MPRYRKLRGALVGQGYRGQDLANYLNLSVAAISRRMTGRTPWSMEEAYKSLQFVGAPASTIFDFFPPDGRAAP